MAIPAGVEAFSCDSGTVKARGQSLSEEETIAAVQGDVSQIISDYKGQEDLKELFSGLATTGFEQAQIQSILSTNPEAYDWRVGEALAEAYLSSHRNCEYPWPGGRDLKNPTASAAGTDLVGLQSQGTGGSCRFSFGEVKTSEDKTCPPSVMYGRHGLKQQLEDLKDSTSVRDSLVKYLGVHAVNKPWSERFRSAAARYIRSTTDVALFGILVRDTSPHVDDLQTRAKKLDDGNNATDLHIELLALYLPSGTIAKLPSMVGTGGAQ